MSNRFESEKKKSAKAQLVKIQVEVVILTLIKIREIATRTIIFHNLLSFENRSISSYRIIGGASATLYFVNFKKCAVLCSFKQVVVCSLYVRATYH